MGEVDSVALVVDADLVASVYVNPHWDPEHKLDLLFEGTITAVNGERSTWSMTLWSCAELRGNGSECGQKHR